MKKLFLLASIFMMAVSATAQDYEEGNDVVDTRKNVVSLGVTAGGNYSMMSKYDPIDLGSRTGIGFQGGLAINAHFGQKHGAGAGTGPIGLQLEVLYAQHSFKTDLNEKWAAAGKKEKETIGDILRILNERLDTVAKFLSKKQYEG